jgi:single-stranded-DNA-specific exonuclease
MPAGVCVHDAGWHPGVVGLIASRLKDRLHRPVVAFAPGGDDGLLRGSARSIPGVHVRDVLADVACRHPDLLQRFGGHAMAAGLSLAERHLGAFSTAFAEAVGARLDPAMANSQARTSAGRWPTRCASPGPGARAFRNRCSTASSRCANGAALAAAICACACSRWPGAGC